MTCSERREPANGSTASPLRELRSRRVLRTDDPGHSRHPRHPARRGARSGSSSSASRATLCERYGYVEMRTPVIEREELFAKGTGETTDIVQKEMYSFTDKGGERVTLRPEATPSMVRAYVEHSLEHALPAAKLFTMGPMFRYERPQKGRYRQFHQLDVEVFGMSDPAVDAEVIDLAWSLVAALGIAQRRARDQLGRLRGVPAAVPGSAARGARRRSAEALRRTASGARRRIRCGSTTARCRPTSRSSIGCRTRSTTSASRARRISPRVQRAPRRLGHSLADLAPARARPRLLHAHDVRDPRADARRAERAARRRPLRRPGEGISAGRIGRASALPPASSGWCWRCRKARAERAAPRAFVAAIGDDGRAEALRLLRELRAGGPAGADGVRGAQHEGADEARRPARGARRR